MSLPKATVSIAAAILLTTASVRAGDVQITVTGEVEYNQINSGPLSAVNPGDAAVLTFTVDSDTYFDSPNYPVRGYEIDHASYSLQLGSVDVGLQDPFPGGQTPYFTLRNDDPAVDGFWMSTNPDFPLGVPLDVTGVFGAFMDAFSVTYGGDALGSLDILDAVGTWAYDGIQVFNWPVLDGPFKPLYIIFESIEISADGGDPCLGDADGSGEVDVNDLVAVILDWGCAEPPCSGDVNGDGHTDISDLIDVILSWGPCR